MTLGKCVLVAKRAGGGFITVGRSEAAALRGQILAAAWLFGDPDSDDGQYLMREAQPGLNHTGETPPDPKRL